MIIPCDPSDLILVDEAHEQEFFLPEDQGAGNGNVGETDNNVIVGPLRRLPEVEGYPILIGRELFYSRHSGHDHDANDDYYDDDTLSVSTFSHQSDFDDEETDNEGSTFLADFEMPLAPLSRLVVDFNGNDDSSDSVLHENAVGTSTGSIGSGRRGQRRTRRVSPNRLDELARAILALEEAGGGSDLEVDDEDGDDDDDDEELLDDSLLLLQGSSLFGRILNHEYNEEDDASLVMARNRGIRRVRTEAVPTADIIASPTTSADADADATALTVTARTATSAIVDPLDDDSLRLSRVRRVDRRHQRRALRQGDDEY